MADEKNQPKMGLFRRVANLIQGNYDDLYRSTYFTDPSNQQQLRNIKRDINSTIKDIMDTSSDMVGEPNISKLYERMFLNAQNNGDTIKEFDRIFADNEFVANLTASYLDNRWVRALDMEIDEILKYMPKLQEALDTITDNVLSADSFSKDYLNITSTLSDSSVSDEQFSRNIEDLKQIYDLPKLVKEIYQKESKYGEVFVYRVPYQKAIQRLLDRKYTNRGLVVHTNYKEYAVLIESAELGNTAIKLPEKYEFTSEVDRDINLNITAEYGIISSIVDEEMKTREKRQQVAEQSMFNEAMYDIDASMQVLSEAPTLDIGTGRAYAYHKVFDQDIKQGGKLPVHHRFDQTLGDKLELPEEDDTTSDGLYDTKKNNGPIRPMNGMIVRPLKRERVVPIIMSNSKVCLGYYYFEFDSNIELFDERLSSTGLVNTLTGLRSNGRSEAFDAMKRREDMLRNIASELANKIDNKFVDNNQDLKKEIYYILKYNDEFNAALREGANSNNIRVSYIPPEDMCHFYFDIDEDTGRGVSDLALSLIPAKLWTAIYITNCLAIMTRGNDKRVYYVRQSVETNIAKTLLKTINEIKKSNFGIRQIENINSVLNITGRFNDYIIPRGADGQSPIEFEVMQGQQIEIKTELLNILEESAINVTGVPIDIIQNRQSPDYAMQLTMSNSKFLRFVYDRQSAFQNQIGKFITDLYNVEFSNRDRITLTLPPPLFINVTNTNQLIQNTNDYCDNIINSIALAGEQDEKLKALAAKELKIYNLGSYINMNVVNNIINKARQQLAKDAIAGDQDGEGGQGF